MSLRRVHGIFLTQAKSANGDLHHDREQSTTCDEQIPVTSNTPNELWFSLPLLPDIGRLKARPTLMMTRI